MGVRVRISLRIGGDSLADEGRRMAVELLLDLLQGAAELQR